MGGNELHAILRVGLQRKFYHKLFFLYRPNCQKKEAKFRLDIDI